MYILVVDDHPMVMQGITSSLKLRGHQADGVRDLPAARDALLDKAPFDMMVLDYNLPGGRGTELLEDAALRMPATVVILSGMTEAEDILVALELGAVAFVPKSAEPGDIITAIEMAPSLDRKLESGYVWDVGRRVFVAASEAFPKGSVLTPKEREVFMLLRRGLLDKQIADELGLSIHTVRVHVRSIKRKRASPRRAERDI